MKIEGLSRTTPVSKSKSKKSSDGGAFASSLNSNEDSSGAEAITQSTQLNSVDALLSLQSVDDATQRRSQGLERGRAVLDALEDIRRGLLLGVIPVQKLKTILKTIDKERENFADPRLEQVIDEIELRGRVELAKLGIFT